MKFFTKHWKWIPALVLGGLLIPQIVFYWFDDFTGFANKTLWDWFELLIIPAVLAVGGFFLTRGENRTDREIAKQNREQDLHIAQTQRETELRIAQEREQQTSLQNYYDRMAELLLDRDLRQTDADDEVRSIARSITLASIRSLDANRKGLIIQFLFESNLINSQNNIIPLEGAFLQGVNLEGIYLEGVDLSLSKLQGANLKEAFLVEAHMQGAHLEDALLQGADLGAASLQGAQLHGANLRDAHVRAVDLRWAFLQGADLRGSSLREANMEGANLQGTDFRGANLEGANLHDAKLTDAKITQEQLDSAINTDNVTGLPDDGAS